MEREVRYCTTSDGIRIAYATFGTGEPLLIVPGWLSHLQWEWERPEAREFYQTLARHRTVVVLDPRGTGMSDWRADDVSAKARSRDVAAVVRDAELAKVALLGISHGGQTCILFAATNPDRVTHLITYASYAHLWVTPEVAAPLVDIVKAQWHMGSAALSSAIAPTGDPGAAALMTDLQRVAADGDAAAHTLQAIIHDDVTEYLTMVKVPTLVIHRRNDPVHPMDLGREIAATIPGARFELVEGNMVTPWLGDSASILKPILSFLGVTENVDPTAPAKSHLRTVLFTDLVGHTEMMSRLGDEKGREVLREHERITREVLKQYGGTEVKTMGDGFLASFASVTKSVECAVALQRAFAEREGEPLSVRVGLNAGEPIEEDGDLFGATVILASRIAAKAAGGEILVADTVRGLCSGKGFLFADRGEFVAKGIEEPVRVYEVRWPHTTAS